MLFHIYKDPKPEGYFIYEPEGLYRTLLDADWIMYILLPLLLAIIVAVLTQASLSSVPSAFQVVRSMRSQPEETSSGS